MNTIISILPVCAGFRSVYVMTKDFYKDKDTYIPIKGIENKNNNNDNDDESGDF